MAGCAVCGAKLGLLEGFFTARGKICERCREIEGLEKRLTLYLAEKNPLARGRALGEDPKSREAARRLVAIDPARRDLALSLECLALERKEPASPDADLAAAALAEVFREKKDPARLEALLRLERAETVVELVSGSEIESRDEWVAVLERLAGAGRADAAVAAALRMRGARTPRLLALVAKQADRIPTEELAKWLRAGRYGGAPVLAEFLRALPAPVSAALLPVAEELTEAGADGLDLALARGDAARAEKILRAAEGADAGRLAALERVADPVRFEEILLGWAAPGPFADRICDLAAKRGLPRAGEIFERAGAWRRALAAAKGDAAATAALRKRLAARLEAGERDAQDRIRRALSAALSADLRSARVALASISSEEAPCGALAARAIAALLAQAELEAAFSLKTQMAALAERLRTRKPLPDQGLVARAVGTALAAFREAVRTLRDADRSPAPALRLCGPVDLAPARAAQERESRREERVEAAALGRAGAEASEREFLDTAVVARLGDHLPALAAGGDPAAAEIPLERPFLYGILAKRILEPLDPDSDEKTGPGETADGILFGLRAYAFLPRAQIAAKEKVWREGEEALKRLVRYRGFEPTGFLPQEEYAPCWMPPPPGRARAAAERLPPLDDDAPIDAALLYREADDPTRHRAKSGPFA